MFCFSRNRRYLYELECKQSAYDLLEDIAESLKLPLMSWRTFREKISEKEWTCILMEKLPEYSQNMELLWKTNIFAGATGNVKLITFIYEKGWHILNEEKAWINGGELYNVRMKNSPIVFATDYGHYNAVKFYLEHAKIEGYIKDEALEHAMNKRYFDIIELLIKHGAKIRLYWDDSEPWFYDLLKKSFYEEDEKTIELALKLISEDFMDRKEIDAERLLFKLVKEYKDKDEGRAWIVKVLDIKKTMRLTENQVKILESFAERGKCEFKRYVELKQWEPGPKDRSIYIPSEWSAKYGSFAGLWPDKLGYWLDWDPDRRAYVRRKNFYF